MSYSDFFTQIGAIGGEIEAQLAPALGISVTFVDLDGTRIDLNGFIHSTLGGKELWLAVVNDGQRIDFDLPAQTNFPPATGIQLFTTVEWTSPVTGDVIPLVVEDSTDLGSLGTLFRVTCYNPLPRQVGAVGIGR